MQRFDAARGELQLIHQGLNQAALAYWQWVYRDAQPHAAGRLR